MPLRTLHDSDGLVYRQSGDSARPPLVYLPGVHGCWTPMARAHPMFERAFHLVEVAYPPRSLWTLADYAESLRALLDHLGYGSVHLVGESFGSLVAWEFGLAHAERVRSHLLLGGLCRAPGFGRAATARAGLSIVPTLLFAGIVNLHVQRKGVVQRDADRGVHPYPAVRQRAGRQATARRMHLIQRADFRPRLGEVKFPVRYLGGADDRVVPVTREVQTLERLLPKACGFDSRLVEHAPHMIVASCPELTVSQLVDWVRAIERERRRGCSRASLARAGTPG